MKIPFGHNALTILIAIALIVISTAALSFLSYHYTVGDAKIWWKLLLLRPIISWFGSTWIASSTRILDNDRILSDMIDVDEPSQWPAAVEAIKKADLNVDQVYFLRPTAITCTRHIPTR